MKPRKPVIMIDFGGVYFTKGGTNAAQKWSKRLNLSKEKIFHALVESGHWVLCTTGKISAREYWNRVARDLKLDRKQLSGLRKDFHAIKIIKGMRPLVMRLKRNNKVVVLSGNTKERINLIKEKYEFNKVFHEQHYSFHYGYEKPDVRLFLSAVKKMNVDPIDCIMVDDNKVFLRAVKKTGAKTVLFKDAKHLETSLRNLGIVV